MRLVKARLSKGYILVETLYEQRNIPKGAGWRWDPVDRWWTADNIGQVKLLLDRARSEGLEVEVDAPVAADLESASDEAIAEAKVAAELAEARRRHYDDRQRVLAHDGRRWVIYCPYGDDAAHKCGAEWDKGSKCFRGDDAAAVKYAAVAEYVTPTASARLAEAEQAVAKAAEAAAAEKAAAEEKAKRAVADAIERLGLGLYPHQKEGVETILARGRILVADEMGLGKTAQAIVSLRLAGVRRAIILTPVSLALVWRDEARRWWPDVAITLHLNGSTDGWDADGLHILPYSRLGGHLEPAKKSGAEALVADESHYLKNSKTARTKAALELERALRPRMVVLLTGTPVLNRPIELWSQLGLLGRQAEIARDWVSYVRRYCGGYRDKYGWRVDGATHLDELASKLSGIMLRRTKAEVLDLPPKVRQVISIRGDASHERAAIAQWTDGVAEGAGWAEVLAGLKDRSAWTELFRARHATALQKVDAVVEIAIDAVESDGCAVVFGHHGDVLDGIQRGLEAEGLSVGRIDGSTDAERRAEIVRSFQDGKLQVVLCSIRAAGVGLTLTRASSAIFAELDWSPAVLEQAEDRLHRIGQRCSITIRYIVIDGSVDAYLASMLADKGEIISAIVDGETIDDGETEEVRG